jgi:CRP-like cAMP-binding protein
MEVHTGQLIFKSGDIGDSMYIIMKGTVNIHKDEKSLANLHENDFFGELSLLDTETRSASATAMSHCHLLKIEQADLYELMESRMEVTRAIIKTLSKRLRRQNEQTIRSAQNDGHGFNV